jgi:hypothetical protein
VLSIVVVARSLSVAVSQPSSWIKLYFSLPLSLSPDPLFVSPIFNLLSLPPSAVVIDRPAPCKPSVERECRHCSACVSVCAARPAGEEINTSLLLLLLSLSLLYHYHYYITITIILLLLLLLLLLLSIITTITSTITLFSLLTGLNTTYH